MNKTENLTLMEERYPIGQNVKVVREDEYFKKICCLDFYDNYFLRMSLKNGFKIMFKKVQKIKWTHCIYL